MWLRCERVCPHAADTPDGLTASVSPLLCVSLYLSPSIHRGPTQVRQHICRPELRRHLPGQTCPRLQTAKKSFWSVTRCVFFFLEKEICDVALACCERPLFLWKSSTLERRSEELRRLARREQKGKNEAANYSKVCATSLDFTMTTFAWTATVQSYSDAAF